MTHLMLGYQNQVIGNFLFTFKASGVSSEVRYVTTLCFHHRPRSSQDSWKDEWKNTAQGALQKAQNMRKTIKLPVRKTQYAEGTSYSLKRGKWRAATLVNTRNMAKSEIMAWCMCTFMNCDLLFQGFTGIFYQVSSSKSTW